MMKIHHFALEVANLEQVSLFYISTLGFSMDEKINFNGEEILFLKKGDIRLELIRNEDAALASDHLHLCFETDNLEKIMERFAENGMKPLEGPYCLKNGWKTVFFRGPANEIIEFLKP